jgi:chromate transporter
MSAAVVLVAHIALLSLISFGGVPGVLPDLRNFVVIAHGWMSDQDFVDCFAIVQALPGPNMILLMGFVGWKIGGLPVAIACALASFTPSCALAYAAFHWWERFRDRAWQRRLRRGLVPVTLGLIIAGGYVMAGSSSGWTPAAVTLAAAIGASLRPRLSPLWFVAAGGALGACGLADDRKAAVAA